MRSSLHNLFSTTKEARDGIRYRCYRVNAFHLEDFNTKHCPSSEKNDLICDRKLSVNQTAVGALALHSRAA